ncbi:MAG TPA: ribonuclease D [Longimicrobiales bacterium]|nr:ribonuclease D [Longimicrobiales bacterium]
MHYVTEAAELTRVASAIRAADLVGVDTEAAGYHRYHDRICLLQVSTRSETFIVDTLALADIEPLRHALENPALETVFHDADYDLRLLSRDFGVRVRNLFDTKVAAQLLGETAIGLAALLEKFLDVRLDKKHQRADWAQRPLPADLIEYAGEDTRHLARLRDALRQELERRGRLAWAEEEFGLRERLDTAPTADDGDAFLRIKNARDLAPRQLAALRELYHWRERVAERRDVAPFRVLTNDVLVAVARALPRDAAALAASAGVPASMADRYGRELLGAVERATALSEDELPRRKRGGMRSPPDPEFDALVERLKGARDRAAEALGLDRGFLMPRQQLEDVARSGARTLAELGAIADMRQWQVEAVGDRLLETLRAPVSLPRD